MNISLYHNIIAIYNKELKENKGQVIKASNSMPVVARVVYQKETYLDWLLDMLSFTN